MTLERTKTGWSVQLRFGKGRRKRFAMPAIDEAKAQDRRARLEQLATLLAEHPKAEQILESVASSPSDRVFNDAERAARDAAAGVLRTEPAGPRTFRDVAELWMSGTLHQQNPRHVRKKKEQSVRMDRARFNRLYRFIGDVLISKFSEADARRAMDALPPMTDSSRYQYEVALRQVLRLAVSPLRLIERVPLPDDFVGSPGKPPAFSFLWPEEDEALLTNQAIPLSERIVYGFLSREGMRISEALALVWADVDLVRGRIALDVNKTETPRAWQLRPDVHRALQFWRKPNDGDEELVFPEFVYAQSARRLREHLRASLELAKLPIRRELFIRTAQRRPLRIHDLRATFVTLELAAGQSETWVMDRTGHTTSDMLGHYRRQARTVEQVAGHARRLGDLDALLGAELAQPTVARGMARNPLNKPFYRAEERTPSSTPDAPTETPQPKTAVAAQAVAQTAIDDEADLPEVARAGHAVARGESDPAATADSPVEQALAYALRAATDQGRWDVVLEVTRELSERRRARVAPAVPSLSDARAKREKGEGK